MSPIIALFCWVLKPCTMSDTTAPSAQAASNAKAAPHQPSLLEQRYIKLLKEVLIDIDNAARFQLTPYPKERSYFLKRFAVNALINRLAKKGLAITGIDRRGVEAREIGLGWPLNGYSMIGMKRMNNIQECIEAVERDGVKGDFIETGVWRGGACIFAKALFDMYRSDRKVWVADSFQGLPKPNAALYPEDEGDDLYALEQLRVSEEAVRENFERFGLLDEKVVFLKGWFKDTLPEAPIDRLSIVRLDGDMYESTMDGLKHLYPKLSPGGFLIIDDYGVIPACKKAVHDYRNGHGIAEEIVDIDGSGYFWRKSF